MLLPNPELVSFVKNQVGLKSNVEGNEDPTVSQGSNVSELEGPNPLQNSGVFVDNLSLFEVEGITGVLGWHFHERLISEGGMIDIFL